MSPTHTVIIGIGGAGLATLTCLNELGYRNADMIAVDTDPEALYHARTPRKIMLSKYWVNISFTNIEPGVKHSALARDIARIRKVTHRDMVILIGALGGMTGTRLIPFFAREAMDQGALVISFPIMPFHCEKETTLLRAHRGLASLSASSDTVIAFSNQTLMDLCDSRPLASRFKLLDSFILQVLRGLVGLVNNWGRINLDLADVRAVLSKKPERAGFIGTCEVRDLTVISQKVLEMFLNPMRSVIPKSVDYAVISIAGTKTLSLQEVDTIVNAITNEIDDDATIKFGIIVDPNQKDLIRVTVLGSYKRAERGKEAVLSMDQFPFVRNGN